MRFAEIVDYDAAAIKAKLPLVVTEKVFEHLTALNQSIFGYAWANGLTTLSSNGMLNVPFYCGHPRSAKIQTLV